MPLQSMNLVMIPPEELDKIKSTQLEILQQLKQLRCEKSALISPKNITAKEFMAVVRICRSKFDQLVIAGKIKTIKKRRKIYVPVSEIDRYFSDSTIL